MTVVDEAKKAGGGNGPDTFKRIAILGGGAWGCALAQVLADGGAAVTVWARDAALAAEIRERHANPRHLPGIDLLPGIDAQCDLAKAAAGAELLVAVVPAQALRAVLRDLAQVAPPGVPLVICAKGLEIDGGRLLSEVAAEIRPDAPVAILSGPNFAAEVARRLPAAAAIASTDPGLRARLTAAFGRPWFRPYPSDDPVGVQVGGAYKNVLAIACGIVTGRKLGENARAALLTRGIAEMARLSVALGGRAETCMGLSGLGDALLSCTSATSRNMRLGLAIGGGASPAEALAAMAAVVEGHATARAVRALAGSRGLDLPVAAAVHAVLHEGAELAAVIDGLLARPYREERPTGP